MLTEYKNKVLDGYYTKHPQGKQLLDIDTETLVEQTKDLKSKLELRDETIEDLEDRIKDLIEENGDLGDMVLELEEETKRLQSIVTDCELKILEEL